MTESILKGYLENNINSKLLSSDLNNSIKSLTSDTSEIIVTKMQSNSDFEIKENHIDKILSDTLNGNLTFDNLKTIASALMFSDYFTWDPKTEVGHRINQIIEELDNTEISFPISTENITLWKDYLKSGIHKLRRK